MNKKQLIQEVAKETQKSKAEAEKIVNSVIETFANGLKKDGMLQLIGFGSFKVKERKAREGRNPKTGEPIKIKACKTASFRPGKSLKEKLV